MKSPPYYPKGNGCIENVHNFLKTCIRWQVSSDTAWNEEAHIAFTTFNFVQNEHAKESAFFLCLEEMHTHYLLNYWIQKSDIWMINSLSLLVLYTLIETYVLTIHNIKVSRERQDTRFEDVSIIKCNFGKYNIFDRPDEAMLFVMVKDCLWLNIFLLYRPLKNFALLIKDTQLWHTQCYNFKPVIMYELDTIKENHGIWDTVKHIILWLYEVDNWNKQMWVGRLRKSIFAMSNLYIWWMNC